MPGGPDLVLPDWPAPRRVRACVTTRRGGVSRGRYASFNPSDRVGDDPRAVAANRDRLARAAGLPAAPAWLRQVHGTAVVDAAEAAGGATADASFAVGPGAVCAVLAADCLPVLLCARDGSAVAAAHAGWRGLAAGVVEAAAGALPVAPANLLAWLGPAIGPTAYEVGDDVRDAFLAHDRDDAAAFRPGRGSRWLADLYLLARRRLARCGVTGVWGGGACTFGEPDRFFSYRRDGETGRMAALIWIESGLDRTGIL